LAIFDKHLSDTRRLLLRPSRASLDDGDLADYCIETIDSLVIDLNAGVEPFFLQSVRIEAVAGQSVYPLSNATNVSRARYLYTLSDTDPTYKRVPIDLVSYENLQGTFGGGDPISTSTPTFAQEPHTAQAAAVYYLRESPGPGDVLEFGPIPNQSASYKLIYEPDVVRPQAKQDPGFRLQQFDGYVAARTALRALPQCKWQGLPEEKEEKRKKEIRDARADEIGSVAERRGYAWQFWVFTQSSTQRSEPTVIGWAQERW